MARLHNGVGRSPLLGDADLVVLRTRYYDFVSAHGGIGRVAEHEIAVTAVREPEVEVAQDAGDELERVDARLFEAIDRVVIDVGARLAEEADRRQLAGCEFMAGFGVPVPVFTVVLVVSSHVLSGLFKLTPGGLQAVDVLALRSYASGSSLTTFSVSEASVAMLWSVVVGVAVMIWAFGFTQMRTLLATSFRRHQEAH